MTAASHERILILDFGSQYTQLIARGIRELRVYSEVQPCSISLDKIRELAPKGIVLSGGPDSVYPGSSLALPFGVPPFGLRT